MASFANRLPKRSFSRIKSALRSRRRMQFESLESRQMLAALTETVALGSMSLQNAAEGNNPYAKMFSAQIESAFERVSDLSSYQPGEVEGADGWVINLAPGSNPNLLTNTLGPSNIKVTDLIPDTYIYNIPAGTDRVGLGARLQAMAGVDYAYPLVPTEKVPMFVPNDVLYPQQWHLNNTGQSGGLAGADANLEGAWDITRGSGVVIGIVDGGIQYTHPDIAPHYLPNLQFDYLDGDSDPAPDLTNDDFHGTAVGGVAAAVGNNNIGVSGAAPDANLTGIRLIGGFTTDLDEAQALTHQNQEIDIYNNSWGYTTHYIQAGPLMTAAFQQGVLQGRGGNGSIFAFANGNGYEEFDDGNYSDYANSWFTIAVAAIDDRGIHSHYSTSGANLLVSGYTQGGNAGSVTTDIMGADGYNDALDDSDGDALADLNYTSTFNGTSSATPLVSGVIALMLAANPNLTWRDVQHILVRTATMNDPTHPDWTTNGAGYHINHDYGFGAIDAEAAVTMAQTWTNVATPINLVSGSLPINQAIPDGTDGLVVTLDITDDFRIEQTELVVNIDHDFPEDLEIIMESPDGTTSILNRTHTDFGFTAGALNDWSFRSTRNWGELVKGTWKFTFLDQVAGDAGTLNSIEFNILGTPDTAQPTGASIAGGVFSDVNANGAFDVATDDFFGGMTVYIDANSNGTLDVGERSTVTNPAGNFMFSGLAAGTYVVDVAPNPLQLQTFPAAANISVTVTANQQSTGTNFGVRPELTSTGPYTLTNGFGDGGVSVGVDGFGSFGSSVSADTDNAIYDPIGPIGPAGTVFESSVAIGREFGERTFLSTGLDGGFDNPRITGDSLTGTSDFVYNNLLFHLVQTLVPYSNTSGTRIGSQLIQTYTITNIGGVAANFDLVRYFDGDLQFDGSLIDGGGRYVSGNGEIMFETDSATNSADSTTFIGITAVGGTIVPTNRYEADQYPYLQYGITAGTNLDQIVENDGIDPDQFVDAGQGYDITLALRNIFDLAPGGVATYVTTTLFGTGIPAEVIDPPGLPPPPPPPIEVRGVVINDFDTDGSQDPNEPGLGNVIVYVDINNDNQIGLGEPAQITNARGEFGFQLREGTYTIRQAQLPGWTSTTNTSYTVTGVAGDILSGYVFGNNSATDWGDAPGPYPTLAAAGGASHSMLTGMYLGSGIDGEGDGQPADRAQGDDLAADDEDGVVFLNAWQPGQTANIDVIVHNGGRSSGLLHAWVDFNADGDWNDAGEQIIVAGRVNEGVNHLSFVVPANAKVTNTYARFRYGYGANVGPTGNVSGGEVEDYFVSIVGPQPIATNDTFEVFRNSVGNKLDVLLNDVGSKLGPARILGYSGIGSLGGTIALNALEQRLVYTPPANTSGVETFTYSITDDKGGMSSATVTVNINTAGQPLVAVDDSFTSIVSSAGTNMNVLANDQLYGANVTLSVPSNSTQRGGSLTIVSTNKTITYRPPAGFTGVDQFQYVIRDAFGRRSEAVVTVQVGDSATDDQAAIELVITDATGAVINEVALGGTFQVHAYVRDLRTVSTNPGVYAAYFDMLYSQGLVAPVAMNNAYGFDITFSPEFNALRSGSASVPGLVNEVGAVRGTNPTDAGPTEVFVANFTALAVGSAKFTTDPADLATLHDVMVDNPQQVVPVSKITFGGTSIDVVAVASLRFQNKTNARDVNNDGKITPLDAVLIVNELNSRGLHQVAGWAVPAKPNYVDVSGDNFVTALDAVIIINYLNSFTLLGGEPTIDEPVVSDAPLAPLASEPDSLLLLPETNSTTAVYSSLVEVEAVDMLGSDVPELLPPSFWLPTGTSESGAIDGGDESDELGDLLDILAGDVDSIWAA